MTPRQQQLLAAIIQEFIETANAVGSLSLRDKYDFNVSPATIRNEMAALVEEGYLDQPHRSAGRVPTTLGLRFFLQELLQDLEELDILTQEKVRSQFHTNRFDKETLIREALKQLVKVSHSAAIALIEKDIYYAGLSEMLNIPEFQEISSLQEIMSIMEDYSALSHIFTQSQSNKPVRVLIGEETGLEAFSNYAIVFSDIYLHGGKAGYIAVIGPNRLDYARVIPAVRFVSTAINQVVSGW